MRQMIHTCAYKARLFFAATFALALLTACSTTSTDVRNLLTPEDNARVAGVRLAIEGPGLQTSSQADTRIFTLHHRPGEVIRVTETVARAFGFNVVPAGEADYRLVLQRAAPDGGACVEGWSAAGEGASFTASVLTFGVVPANATQCLQVNAKLFVMLADEPQLLSAFESANGRVTIIAGARDVDRYRSSVDRDDELKALEVSIGGLLQRMIREGAFD